MQANERWEYKLISSDRVQKSGGAFSTKSSDDIEVYLNNLGRQGWEIVSLDFFERKTAFFGVAKRGAEEEWQPPTDFIGPGHAMALNAAPALADSGRKPPLDTGLAFEPNGSDGQAVIDSTTDSAGGTKDCAGGTDAELNATEPADDGTEITEADDTTDEADTQPDHAEPADTEPVEAADTEPHTVEGVRTVPTSQSGSLFGPPPLVGSFWITVIDDGGAEINLRVDDDHVVFTDSGPGAEERTFASKSPEAEQLAAAAQAFVTRIRGVAG